MGRRERRFVRTTLLIALVVGVAGLSNAAFLVWFLDEAEAQGATMFLAGEQRALAAELHGLLVVRATARDAVETRRLADAIDELDRAVTTMLAGGEDGGATLSRAPESVRAGIGRVGAVWRSLRAEATSLAERPGSDAVDPESVRRAVQLTNELSAAANDVVDALRRARRDDRTALVVVAGMTAILSLGAVLAGYRLAVAGVARPVAALRRRLRRGGAPPPDGREMPPGHEPGGALEEAEADYRGIFFNSLAGIYRIDAEGRVLLANPAFARMLGYDSPRQLEDSVGNAHDEIFLDPSHRHGFDGVRDAPLEDTETSMRRRDGTTMWVLDSAQQVWRNGAFAYVEGVVVDITPRKHAADAVRQLSGRLLQVRDEERRRISRDLHDRTGQLLAALEMNLDRLGDEAELTSDQRKLLSDCLELSRESSRQTRTLSQLLHPPLLEELGLSHALREHVTGYRKRSGIDVTLDMDELVDRLDPAVESCLFRVVQECLTNVHRHSGSERVVIRLHRTSTSVTAEVEDYGGGIPDSIVTDADGRERIGVGLRGIRARLEQLDGRLEIRSSPEGTRIRAVIETPAA